MNIELQQRIIKEASQLFTQKGIRAVTMDMIATHLGISKRTLYENFSEKNELLLACLEKEEQTQKERWNKYFETRKNVIDLLLNIYEDVLTMVNSVSPVFFEDMKRYHPKANDKYEDEVKNHRRGTVKLLSEGVEEGLIRSDVNLDIAATLLNLQFEMLKTSERVFESQYTFLEIFETIFKSFIRGIATPEGVKYADDYFRNK